MGTLRQNGPGMLPRGLAVLLGLFGVALVVKGYAEGFPRAARSAEPRTEVRPGGRTSPALRGPICLFAGVCLFGLGVRTVGFLVAGPLVVVVSALASAETRWGENVAFAGVMTAFCFFLFKTLLSLPIPVAPWILGY
jgi:putative tricarboxylic transport membrane protein